MPSSLVDRQAAALAPRGRPVDEHDPSFAGIDVALVFDTPLLEHLVHVGEVALHAVTAPVDRPLDAAGDRRSELASLVDQLSQRLEVPRVEGLDRSSSDVHVPLGQAHTGITPCFFHGRSTRLVAAISSPRMMRGRVSRGSMMSSTMSLPAAM